MAGVKGFTWETADEIDMDLAQRVTRIRKRKKITQGDLGNMSGVSLGSIRRFEQSGQISLLSLTKIAMALDCVDEIKNAFLQVPYRNIQEVIDENR